MPNAEQVPVQPELLAALIERANGDPNAVEVSTLRMTDLELEAVACAYEEFVRVHPGMSAGLRSWYTQLAEGARSTLQWRACEERDLQRAEDLPRNWAEALSRLQQEGEQ